MKQPATSDRDAQFDKILLEEMSTAIKRSGYLRWSLAGDLAYAAECIRNCSKRIQREDAGETEVARANMRACASRLAKFARALPRIGQATSDRETPP